MALLDLFQKPKNKEIHAAAVGDYGTVDEGFEVSSEHKPPLRGQRGSITYEQMSFDSQIGMMLNAIKSVILSADWDFSIKSDDEKQKFHNEFCKEYFFNNYPLPFVNLLYQILTFSEYGFSLFEQVYRIWNFENTNYTVPELLARLQTSIEEIDPNAQTVKQRKTDGQEAIIPFEYLVFFTLNQEGDDLRGTSLLRWSYWDWKRKSETEIIDTLGVRKNALGIPKITIPHNVKKDSDDFESIENVMRRIGRSQNPYMILYPDYNFDWTFGNYNNAITNQKIARHNSQIAKTFMGQFLELGQSGKGGSFALGDIQSQIFLDSLQYLIDLICSNFNKKVIKPMIDINFGEQDVYPELIGLNVNKGKIQNFINNYALLLEKRAIKPSVADEDFIRTKMEMRNLTDEEKAEREKEKDIGPQSNDINNDMNRNAGPQALSEKSNKPLKLAEKTIAKKRKERDDFIDFNKPLLTDFMRGNLTLMKDKLLADLEKILNRGELAQRGLNTLEVSFQNKYKEGLNKKISYFASEGFKSAKKDAAGHTNKIKLAEIPDVNPKNLPDNLRVYAKNMSSNIVDDQATTMKVRAIFVSQNKMDKGYTVKQAIAEANTSLDTYINSGQISTASSHLIADGTNMGSMEFGKDSDVIQAYEFVAVDDAQTTDVCKWLNGHIYDVGSVQLSQVRPPLHYNCRSFMNPIYTDEPKVVADNEIPPPSIWNTRDF
jgi:SPP1 gp7 family putative phage head morphogenesis protein